MSATLQDFQQAVEDLKRLAKAKPYTATAVKFAGKDDGYGKKPAGFPGYFMSFHDYLLAVRSRPAAGSKSEARGLFAAKHVHHELMMLCDMVYQEGIQYADGTAAVPFGTMFQLYSVINNKLVGLLMRARKHGFLYFEGEMLFQRRDDDKPILLLKPIDVIRQELSQVVEFQLGQAIAPSQ